MRLGRVHEQQTPQAASSAEQALRAVRSEGVAKEAGPPPAPVASRVHEQQTPQASSASRVSSAPTGCVLREESGLKAARCQFALLADLRGIAASKSEFCPIALPQCLFGIRWFLVSCIGWL